MNEQPFMSIVTPVYNGERYLAECIESVLSQSYQRFEYIIANNGSTDRSLEIARAYQKKDGRIRVVDNETHLGQVDNINQLLRKISPTSKYCKMIFADDWLYPECIERMVGLAENHPSVGIVSSYYLWGKAVMNVGLLPSPLVYRGSDICRRMLLTGEFFFGTPSVILWRSDLIRSRDHFYSRDSLHEDTEACYEFLQDWDFGFIPQVLTYVCRGNASITSSSLSYDPDYVFLDNFITMKKYGPSFLNEDEYKRRIAQIEKAYMIFLGKSLIKGRKKDFWTYHKKGLSTINVRLNTGRLIKYSILVGLDLVCNPKSTIQRFIVNHKGKKALPLDADDHDIAGSKREADR